MKIAVIISCLVALSQANVYDAVREEWNNFKLKHNKQYKNEIEESFRMKIYIENKRNVEKHNKKYEKGLVTFKMAINKFADMLHHEFVAIMNGYDRSLALKSPRLLTPSTFIPLENVAVPDAIDWREKGAVTPVKDQGECGSCYAFSATGALEGQHFRKTGKLVSLSEQNLVDCSMDYGNEGCNGGMMNAGFEYIKDNEGVDTETSYPYEGKLKDCRYDAKNKGATDSGFVEIPEGSESKLQMAIGTTGPVSVAIDANQQSFMLYSEGVYYEPECSPSGLSHAVLVVGYGTQKGRNGEDEHYWIVKNSWGEGWGEGGYVKMAKDKDNNCGIATVASFPLA